MEEVIGSIPLGSTIHPLDNFSTMTNADVSESTGSLAMSADHRLLVMASVRSGRTHV